MFILCMPIASEIDIFTELTVFELRDDGYALVAKTSAPFAVGRPFAVSIDPADLTRGLRR